MNRSHDGFTFRTPTDFQFEDTIVKRALIIGSCFAETYANYRGFYPHFDCDFILINHVSELPESPPQPISDYDFQLISLPLRTIMPEASYFRLDYSDTEGHNRLFEECKERLSLLLSAALKWNFEHKILSFVTNFFIPQQNPYGRLLPKSDLRNPVYFISKINEYLEELCSSLTNCYVVDIDAVASSIGKQYIQDDFIYTLSHGTYFNNFDAAHDQNRIETIAPLAETFKSEAVEFMQAAWREIRAMYRTVHQTDAVKLIAIDLDDTLWRGVLAEEFLAHPEPLEGWPLGFAEALLFLKKRGLMLAILSKNSAEKIEAAWDSVFHGVLKLSDFAAVKINWDPKAQNMESILREVNILPRSVVFIDDNPVERSAMLHAFPDMRIIGANPYMLRRALLWSSETQVPFLSAESTRRTEMVQAQIERSKLQSKVDRPKFLAELNIRVTPIEISSIDNAHFKRSFELLNKTNQFNTTGQRWSIDDIASTMSQGASIYSFHVADKFTDYGIVAVSLVTADTIEQFVMSCRVIGLDVEKAALSHIVESLAGRGVASIKAVNRETKDNLLSRDLFKKCEFEQTHDSWVIDAAARFGPSHITMMGRGEPAFA